MVVSERRSVWAVGAMRFVLVLALLPLIAGCLPAAGPSRTAIVSDATAASGFDVIALTQPIAELLARRPAQSLSGTFGLGNGVPALTIGVGDHVAVTIYEAASGGLFSGEAGTLGAGTKSVTLPPQPVARDGTIGVPYAGRVRAAGLTPANVQDAIQAALQDKAIEPQAVVTLAQEVSTFVTVTGDVATPRRLPLNLKGDRLLDVIAMAGGARAPDYNTFVQLTRGKRSATMSLARIVRDPGENIYVRPNDLVYVFTDAQTYTAFGATSRNARFDFRSDRLTLAEAVGEAGGLLDDRADPKGVFVFRFEAPEAYRLIRAGRPTPPQAAGIPVIYSLNLKTPQGYFIAQRFLMRNDDLIYVSNASAVSVEKALSIVGTSVGISNNAVTLQNRLD